MTNIRPFTLKNSYFPDNKEELEKEIKNLIMSIPTEYNAKTRSVIVPHDSYKDSGKTAMNAMQYLDKGIETVFIMAPAHYIVFFGIALSCYDAWETPLGEAIIDKSFNQDLVENFDAECNDRVFENEHSIDIQIPLVQTILPDAKIVPISYGSHNFKKVTAIMDKYFVNEKIGFILVSDLAHFDSLDDAQKMDETAASEIERKAILATSQENKDAAPAPKSERGYSLIRTDIDPPNPDTGKEGYGSWIVVEKSIPNFLKDEFSDTILTICRNSIISGLEFSMPVNADIEKLAPVFDTFWGTYITVFVDGELRGRAGSAFAVKPLKDDLALNAYNAAFKTKTPVFSDEIDRMKLEICILSRPQMIPFASLNDLAEKINESSGIIIRNNETQAAFLPCMWKEYPDKKGFINALLKEAGIDENPSPSAFEAYQFKVVTIDG